MIILTKEINMQKIIVIGNAGSGKTTFSKALSKKLNLPLIHLDKIFWYGIWHHISRENFDKFNDLIWFEKGFETYGKLYYKNILL